MKQLFSCLILVWTLSAEAQELNDVSLEQAKRFLQSEREQIFINSLQLSISQAVIFHPIFVEYNREKKELDELLITKFVKYSEGYQTMNPKTMRNFIKSTRRLQNLELKLRQKYYSKLRKDISPEIAIQFYEVDDLLATTLRLNILSSLPFLSNELK
jgi:hypothetical protein